MPPVGAPIIVTGPGRCGSTWMQTFLSQHPSIHIHGQTPRGLLWSTLWEWHQTLVGEGKRAVKANKTLGYEVPHYAGSRPKRCREIMQDLIRRFYTGLGEQKPRWGIKWIGMSDHPDEVEQLESLWPDARWVVCIRDPFRVIESLKNTFQTDDNVEQIQERAEVWVRTCRFVESHDGSRVVGVLMDKLDEQTPKARRAMMGNVLACVGEKPSKETDSFVSRWPTIHKVKPDEKRTFSLTVADKRGLLREVAGLADCMEKLGYPIP